jgi:glycosyltransferase involved in cell wall biosynthesis
MLRRMPEHRESAATGAASPGGAQGPPPRTSSPELTVVLPAFNQAGTIAANLREILRLLDGAGLEFEMVVVSDGSLDATHAQARTLKDPRVRVLRYDRNMGKGYALRTGSAEARGRYVAWLDSDLDLDPTLLTDFVGRARRDGLDIVVGSKRHPGSEVAYPLRRRVYSWLYQQLVRAMFALNVRDTQVGMKLFRREVLDEVLPVVLVKRYAFDLEMLAVANSFGFTRIAEAPIRLDYQFAGTGMHWRAIAQALWDTAAIFYRLRLLRYYPRQRGLARRVARHRGGPAPDLTVLLAPDRPGDDLQAAVDRIRDISPDDARVLVAYPGSITDAPAVEGARVVGVGVGPRPERLQCALAEVDTEVVALADPACIPSDRWVTAALDLLADPDVGVVTGPVVARLDGTPERDAAGILSESRIGVGGTRIRHHVGRLREVGEFPARSIFVRTDALARAVDDGFPIDDAVCAAIGARQGLAVLCSPDVVTSISPAPLWRPHLLGMHRTGVASGRRIAEGNLPRLRTLAPLALLAGLIAAPRALRRSGPLRTLWLTGAGAYAATIAAFAAVLIVLHRRPRLVALAAAGAAASHLSYAVGVVRGALVHWARRGRRTNIPRR